MITRENLKWAIENIGSEKIDEVINESGDYVLFEIHHFNVGSYPELTSYDYDDEIEMGAVESGNLFCDKDEFLTLIEEVGAFE